MSSRRAALASVALLLALAAIPSALAGGGKGKWSKEGHGGYRSHGMKKGNWLPDGVSRENVAAVRMTFPNGTVVERPFAPVVMGTTTGAEGGGTKWGRHGAPLEAEGGGEGHKMRRWGGKHGGDGGAEGGEGKRWGGGRHGGWGGGWKKGGERPAIAFVLKDGSVVEKPTREWRARAAFEKEDVKGVTAVYADGTTKPLTMMMGPKGEKPVGGGYGEKQVGGGNKPASIVIELKNGTKITKSMGKGAQP